MKNEEERLCWHMEQDFQGGPTDAPPPWGASTRCIIECKPGVKFISVVVTYNTYDIDGDTTGKTAQLIMPAGQPRLSPDTVADAWPEFHDQGNEET